MLRHFFLNDFNADRVATFFLQNIAQQTLHQFDAQLRAGQSGVGGNANQRTFQTANVASDPVCQKTHNLFRQFHPHKLRLLTQNRQSHLRLRWLQVGDQAPLKA